MELSSEDNFRLNVLLANPLQAIRIDETTLTVYGLTTRGEAKIQLHPTCGDDIYLRRVRELISSHILGSPGGYPTFLKRWSRMGFAKADSLEQLLKLGEPEAVVAVVHAPDLTVELARYAWWAYPSPQNARGLLTHPTVAQSELGKELAHYLLDYLPFEQEPLAIIETTRLILQSELIDPETQKMLWSKGQKKSIYLVGFIWTQPNTLPVTVPEHPQAARLRTVLDAQNPLAEHLLQATSSAGQAFLQTCQKILRHPSHQEVVNSVFDLIAQYFHPICPDSYTQDLTVEHLITQATQYCEHPPADPLGNALAQTLTLAPESQPLVRAMLVLAGLRYSVVSPVFSRTTAVGSLMRKKLAPIMEPILAELDVLQNVSADR